MSELGDSFQRELIWVLDQKTDLSQQEIADHPLVDASQPTVSRVLDKYDPALDGFDIAAEGYGDDEAIQKDEEPATSYREAIADTIWQSAVGRTAKVHIIRTSNTDDNDE